MSFGVAPTISPTYGVLNGYVLANSDGTFGNVAQVINLHSSDIVQFVNVDNTAPTTLIHSAVGFPGAPPFPAVPYSFPAGTQFAVGSTISAAQWSSGRIGPACYSAPFSVTAGTFYFGDYDYYNLDNMRDVIIVSNSTPRR